MLSLMSLKKFQKRYKELVGVKELKAAGFDAPKFLKRGLLIFAGLTLILATIFIITPSYWGFWRKDTSQSENKARKALTFAVANQSSKEWKDVELILENALNAEGSDTAELKSVEITDKGSFHYFKVGTIKPGQSKDVTVFVLKDYTGSFTYTATFKDASGKVVRLPEEREVTFE